MELFLVLFLFGILLYATGQICLRAVTIFENREKYPTTAILKDIEYREKPNTTIYHVEFDDMNNNHIKAKSLQYRGKPKFKKGDILDIDYLIRDEMKTLIESELVDVKHKDHISIYDSMEKPIKIVNIISILFVIASIISLIVHLVTKFV